MMWGAEYVIMYALLLNFTSRCGRRDAMPHIRPRPKHDNVKPNASQILAIILHFSLNGLPSNLLVMIAGFQPICQLMGTTTV